MINFKRDIEESNQKIESRLAYLEYSVSIVDSLEREQYEMTQSLRAMVGMQSQEQLDSFSLITARMDEINFQIRELLKKLQAIQLYGGIDTTPSQPAPVSSPTAARPSPSTSPAPTQPLPGPVTFSPNAASTDTLRVDPEKLYNSALENLRNGNYLLSESLFLSFLMQFPDNELAGNAQYWLGEAAYAQEEYKLAITEFTKVLDKFTKSQKLSAAMLKIGFSQIAIGENKAGTAMLERLIKSYPKSEEADLAREKLTIDNQ